MVEEKYTQNLYWGFCRRSILRSARRQILMFFHWFPHLWPSDAVVLVQEWLSSVCRWPKAQGNMSGTPLVRACHFDCSGAVYLFTKGGCGSVSFKPRVWDVWKVLSDWSFACRSLDGPCCIGRFMVQGASWCCFPGCVQVSWSIWSDKGMVLPQSGFCFFLFILLLKHVWENNVIQWAECHL